MNIDRVRGIETKEDLACFVDDLRRELVSAPSNWENLDLESFLFAISIWVRAIDSYSANTGDADVLSPSWSTFAKIMCAASVYE